MWCSLLVVFKIATARVRHVQDGVGCGGLRDMEVQLSQNYTLAVKGNKRLFDQFLHSSLELETLLWPLGQVFHDAIILSPAVRLTASRSV